MQKLIAPAILWICSIAITLFCFSEIAFNPNTSIIGASEDGIKNYYTYLYYIANDGGGTHFSGMNYPFGEHIVFTDNMPLLAGAISWLKNWFPGLGHYSLAIMHLLLLSSISFGTWYIFKIIRKYNNNATWAIISALFIAFFSPQIFKIYRHYGMGFCFYIPFVIYQLQCFKEKGSLRYPLAIFICSFLLTFIHLYNLVLIGILVVFYCIAYLIAEQENPFKEKLRTIIPVLLSVGLNFILARVFLKVTDPINDRPEYPHGILGYETQGKDLLVTDTPLGNIFSFLFGKPAGIAESEGKAYLGVVTLTICFILIFKFIRSFFKKYRATRTAIQPIKAYNIWLLVGLFHLLFAMGVPAVWIRSWLAEYISVFRQFRTIGRFIWPFYYIIMIYASLYLYHYAQVLKTKHKARLAYGLLSAAVLLWSVQLSGYLKYNRDLSRQALDNYTRLFETPVDNWTAWLQEKGYRADDFQAAICLPFYHIGSEKIWLMDIDEGTSAYELFKVSIQTRLPIVNVMMSRTSWSQTFEMIQVIDGPYTKKKYFDRLNSKPLLLLVNEVIELKSKEKEWIKNATFIGRRQDKLSVYAIDVKAMQQNESIARQTTLSAASQVLPRKEGLLHDSTNAFFYTNHFDHTGFEKSFIGKGSFAPVYSRQKAPLDTILLPAQREDSFYNLSLWAQCNMIDYRGPAFDLIQLDKNGQAVDTTSGIGAKYSTHVIGDWFFVDKDFTIAPHAQKIVIIVHRNSSKKEYYAIDELMLRPQAATHFYWADAFQGKKKVLFLNNRPQF